VDDLGAALEGAGARSSQKLACGRVIGVEGYRTKSSCRLLLLILSLLFRFGCGARGCGGGGVGSHVCCWLSVVNDETSNGEMVVKGELELREALLKFRGPERGDSEKELIEGGLTMKDLEGSILSVSAGGQSVSRTGTALIRQPFWISHEKPVNDLDRFDCCCGEGEE
jgi:hypothetical protein